MSRFGFLYSIGGTEHEVWYGDDAFEGWWITVNLTNEENTSELELSTFVSVGFTPPSIRVKKTLFDGETLAIILEQMSLPDKYTHHLTQMRQNSNIVFGWQGYLTALATDTPHPTKREDAVFINLTLMD